MRTPSCKSRAGGLRGTSSRISKGCAVAAAAVEGKVRRPRETAKRTDSDFCGFVSLRRKNDFLANSCVIYKLESQFCCAGLDGMTTSSILGGLVGRP